MPFSKHLVAWSEKGARSPPSQDSPSPKETGRKRKLLRGAQQICLNEGVQSSSKARRHSNRRGSDSQIVGKQETRAERRNEEAGGSSVFCSPRTDAISHVPTWRAQTFRPLVPTP